MGVGVIGESARERIEAFVRDVTAEMEFESLSEEAREDFTTHLLEATERRVAAGISAEEAVRLAIEDFGAPKELKRRLRAAARSSGQPLRPARTISWGERLRSLIQDARLSARASRRRPLIPTVVVFTIAVGLAATTVVYSVVEVVLLDPPPFPEPDRLVVLANEAGDFGVTSPANFIDIRDQTTAAFESFSAYAPTTVVAQIDEAVERVDAYLVSSDYIRTLGVPALLGQTFDRRHEAGDIPEVLVSHSFWVRHLGGSNEAASRSIVVDGTSRQVIGVMPEGFRLHDPVDIWLPLTLVPGESSRGSNYLFAIGRLDGGAGLNAAQASFDVVAARLRAEYPTFFGDGPLPLRSLQSATVVGVEARLRFTGIAVLIVMLLVCVNVANLLFARVTDRRDELALRRSLGAPRARIARLVLTDAVVLVSAGSVLGLCGAGRAIATLRGWAPRGLPGIDRLVVDSTVLAAALVATLGVCLLAIGPITLHILRDDKSLRGGGGRTTAGARRLRLRRGVVVLQVAGSALLMAYGGLLVQSFASLSGVEPGFDTERLLTAQVALNGDRFGDPASRWQYFSRLVDRLEDEPGVSSVTVGTFRPTSGGFTRRFALADRPPPPDDAYFFATFDPVAPGYFETLGIPLRMGRTFEALDASDERPVAIVNDAFVAEFFQGSSPVGIWLGFYVNGEPRSDQLEIVGVVGDVRSDALSNEARPAIYLPMSISPMTAGTAFIRLPGGDALSTERVQVAFREVDATQPPYSIRPMSEVYARSIERDRLLMWLIAAFAGVALVLALSGVFGLTSFTVGRRTREFGLRIALGAEPSEIVRGTTWAGLRDVALGVVLGLAVAWAAAGTLQSTLYEVGERDWTTYAVVATTLLAISALAITTPARRAGSVHPLEALRHD